MHPTGIPSIEHYIMTQVISIAEDDSFTTTTRTKCREVETDMLSGFKNTLLTEGDL